MYTRLIPLKHGKWHHYQLSNKHSKHNAFVKIFHNLKLMVNMKHLAAQPCTPLLTTLCCTISHTLFLWLGPSFGPPHPTADWWCCNRPYHNMHLMNALHPHDLYYLWPNTIGIQNLPCISITFICQLWPGYPCSSCTTTLAMCALLEFLVCCKSLSSTTPFFILLPLQGQAMHSCMHTQPWSQWYSHLCFNAACVLLLVWDIWNEAYVDAYVNECI